MLQTRITIVGRGFAGLAAAKALPSVRAYILLTDRAIICFNLLLYQVATSELTPGQIGFPVRKKHSLPWARWGSGRTEENA